MQEENTFVISEYSCILILIFKLEKKAFRILECIACNGNLSTQNGDSHELVTPPVKPLL